MKNENNAMNSKLTARLSVVALCLALLGGVFVGGMLVIADAEPGGEKPEARRTGYVDFLVLLKKDTPLRAMQTEIQFGIQTEMDAIEAKYVPLIQEQQETKRIYNPDSRQYRQAMQKQLRFERLRYQEQLLLEQTAQMELRDEGIRRFKELRNLSRDIAINLGYNEVLNIVRDIEEVAEAQADFQSLQQQLLISPVLHYEESHDITDEVLRQAEDRWGSNLSFESGDVDVTNNIRFTVEGEDAPVDLNDDGELELRLGQKGKFSIDVFKKGEKLPADDSDAEVVWSKAGFGVGELDEDGSFTVSKEWPTRGGDSFTIYVRSAVDPAQTKKATIKLLSADGKSRAEDEDDAEDGGEEAGDAEDEGGDEPDSEKEE